MLEVYLVFPTRASIREVFTLKMQYVDDISSFGDHTLVLRHALIYWQFKHRTFQIIPDFGSHRYKYLVFSFLLAYIPHWHEAFTWKLQYVDNASKALACPLVDGVLLLLSMLFLNPVVNLFKVFHAWQLHGKLTSLPTDERQWSGNCSIYEWWNGCLAYALICLLISVDTSFLSYFPTTFIYRWIMDRNFIH